MDQMRKSKFPPIGRTIFLFLGIPTCLWHLNASSYKILKQNHLENIRSKTNNKNGNEWWMEKKPRNPDPLSKRVNSFQYCWYVTIYRFKNVHKWNIKWIKNTRIKKKKHEKDKIIYFSSKKQMWWPHKTPLLQKSN